MSETRSQLSARSRAPIDDTAVKWWELYGESDSKEYYGQNQTDDSSKFEKEDKSTSTNTLNVQRQLVTDAFEKEIAQKIEALQIDETLDPTGRVLKKWKEHVSRIRYEQARKALIKALKLKFEEPGRKHFKLHKINKVRQSNIKEKFGEMKTSSNPNTNSLSVSKTAVNENKENVVSTIISEEGNSNRDGVSQRIYFWISFVSKTTIRDSLCNMLSL